MVCSSPSERRSLAGLIHQLNWELIRAMEFDVVWEYRLPLLKGLGHHTIA